MKKENSENWTIDLSNGMLKKDGKDTGVSFIEVATSPEFKEFIRDEIDNEILSELLAKSPEFKKRFKKK